jgi:hypothetical protein
MLSFKCIHCARPVFPRRHQPQPVSPLCIPCTHEAGELRRAEQSWHEFQAKLLARMALERGDASVH